MLLKLMIDFYKLNFSFLFAGINIDSEFLF